MISTTSAPYLAPPPVYCPRTFSAWFFVFGVSVFARALCAEAFFARGGAVASGCGARPRIRGRTGVTAFFTAPSQWYLLLVFFANRWISDTASSAEAYG